MLRFCQVAILHGYEGNEVKIDLSFRDKRCREILRSPAKMLAKMYG